MEILNVSDLILNLHEEKIFLKEYLHKINVKGYSNNDTLYLRTKISSLESILKGLYYKSLSELLMNCSNRRLEKIICGEEYLVDIMLTPNNYRLVIDLNSLEDSDIKHALIFQDLRDKYCYFKHKDNCKTGLEYVKNKWQILR